MKTLDEIIFELTKDYLSEYDAAVLATMIAVEVKRYYKFFFVAGMGAGAGLLVMILKWVH